MFSNINFSSWGLLGAMGSLGLIERLVKGEGDGGSLKWVRDNFVERLVSLREFLLGDLVLLCPMFVSFKYIYIFFQIDVALFQGGWDVQSLILSAGRCEGSGCVWSVNILGKLKLDDVHISLPPRVSCLGSVIAYLWVWCHLWGGVVFFFLRRLLRSGWCSWDK